jgi:hypothetical protein
MSLHGAERSSIEVVTEWGVSECVREVSIKWRLWPTRGCCAIEKRLCVSHQMHLSIKDVENRVLWYVTPRGLLNMYQFLSASAKLRKATISRISCLSALPFPSNSLAPTVTIFMKFHIWIFFENMSTIFIFIKIWQKRVPHMKKNIHFLLYRPRFLEWEMFQTKLV